jgi:putative aldouronate transport system substrate-binding protein
MKKRIGPCLVAILLALVLAAGCKAGGAGGGVANLTAAGELPIVKGAPVTIKLFYVPDQFVEDMKTNYATQWLEEKTKVKIDWMLASSTDATEKLNLLLAANNKTEMPDAFMTYGMSRQVCEAYGVQGVLADLTPLIDKYGVNLKKLMARNDKLDKRMTAYDGKKYFLFRYYETVHVRHTQRMWMNVKWLERLKLKVPTTTDEFYDVLKAFRDKDANGNGDAKDEVPFVAFTGYWVNDFGKGLMNSFVYSPAADTKLYYEDGKVKVSYAEEGWREGLRFYKKLYDGNLLDHECFSMTYEQAKALASAKNGNRVGCLIGGVVTLWDFTDPTINEFEVISPLKGPTGLRQSAFEGFNPTPFFAISAASQKKEVAYRWADAQQYDSSGDIANGDFTWLNFWYGKEGVGWAKSDASAKGFTGQKAMYKWIFNWGAPTNTHWYETFLINMPETWKPLMEAPASGTYPQEKILYESTVQKMYPYSVDKALPLVSMDEPTSLKVAQLETALITYYKEMQAKFVRGEKSLDKDWDAYVAELKKIGLDEYLGYYQKAYKP